MAQAKSCHDELETYYRTAVDFEAVDAEVQKCAEMTAAMKYVLSPKELTFRHRAASATRGARIEGMPWPSNEPRLRWLR